MRYSKNHKVVFLRLVKNRVFWKSRDGYPSDAMEFVLAEMARRTRMWIFRKAFYCSQHRLLPLLC